MHKLFYNINMDRDPCLTVYDGNFITSDGKKLIICKGTFDKIFDHCMMTLYYSPTSRHIPVFEGDRRTIQKHQNITIRGIVSQGAPNQQHVQDYYELTLLFCLVHLHMQVQLLQKCCFAESYKQFLIFVMPIFFVSLVISFLHANMEHVLVCFTPACMFVEVVPLAAQCSQMTFYLGALQAFDNHHKLLLTMLDCPREGGFLQSCQRRLRQGFGFFSPYFFSSFSLNSG